MSAPKIDMSTRYDRQIRLWANDGQSRLESAHVCLVNATAAGAETLKNLVLPGIGSFTIIDNRLVAEDDLSGNFFLEKAHLGSPIACAMAQSLLELNPDVNGQGLEVSVESTFSEPEFWAQFSVVVVSGYLKTTHMSALRDLLWARNIPLLLISTCGFYATLNILAKETTVVETHDPSKIYDLRIDCPWPELAAFSDSFNIDLLDDTEHAHVPYIVIFIKALSRWRQDHAGLAPQNYAEKKEFRSKYIENMARNISLETNFIEAAQSVHRALQVTQVPKSTKQLFERPEVSDLGSQASKFWLHVRALKAFVKTNDGLLPLPGNIPDMAATTANYVQLQILYRDKASSDRKNFITEVQKVYSEAEIPLNELDDNFASLFCKNAAFLFVSNGSNALFSESLLSQLRSRDTVETPQHNDLAIYFGMLALQKWVDAGSVGGFEAFVNCFEQLTSLDQTAMTPGIKNTLTEMFTHNMSSYHNICSLIGGIAGQEVLKIATAQYIPLDNLFVFDGIRSSSSKWKV